MKTSVFIRTRRYDSPCGQLLLGALGDRLCLCDWQTAGHRERVLSRLRRVLSAEIGEGCSDATDEAARQLDEYFAGRRRVFSVPLLFAGSEFQRSVWQCLLGIPYGQRMSYGQMARLLGRPRAVRAVASANGANALSILVPCHRVIGSDGSLTGYAGGLEAKRFLLGLEERGR